MDEFADRISQVPRETADVPAVLFADDVPTISKIPRRITEPVGHSIGVGRRGIVVLF